MTPEEIAREAAACVRAGTSVLHLHVRDDEGKHSLDPRRYLAAMDAIYREVGDDLIVQITTEAVGLGKAPQQIEVVQSVCPRAASVALRELIPNDSFLPQAADFFAWSKRQGVALQFILYTPQEARQLKALVEAGVVCDERPNSLFVLGRYSADQQSAPMDLLAFLSDWPQAWPWSVCAFGLSEARCMAAAIGLGGHVRVGFENNLHLPDGRLADGTSDLASIVQELARGVGRGTASVAHARHVYGLSHSKP
jgi:uncharacterized protein (DUF849 family)